MDFFPLLRSDAYPTKYSGGTTWRQAGVYYWQVHKTQERFEPATGRVEFTRPLGPVRRITVTASPMTSAPYTSAPTLRLAVNEGYSIVRNQLKRRFGARFTRGKKLTAGYSRLSATTIRYRVSWLRRGSKYAGTVKVREHTDYYSSWVNVHRR